MSRFAWFVPAVGLAILATGCGDKGAVAPDLKYLYTKPADYWGTYLGTRMDLEDSAMAESTEELIGSSTLTLDAEDVTFPMDHEGIKFGGTCQYRAYTNADGKKFRAMELIVYEVEGVMKTQIDRVDVAANKAAGRKPSTPEMLQRYRDIMLNMNWRFELLPDGFRQLDSDSGPGMYEFHREASGGRGGPAPFDLGIDVAEESDDADSGRNDRSGARGIANVGG